MRQLHPNAILFDVVQHLLRQRWSPEQIALTLARISPKGHALGVSHETIYNCIYAQLVGELRKDLIACLRHAHNKRVPHSKGQDRRDQIPDMLSTHLRPPDVEDCLFPGYWEGDLIKGEGNASAAGTLVKLPHPKPARTAPTRTPTDWCASICPRAQTCRSTARSSSMRLPTRSMADRARNSGYDHRSAVCRELLLNSPQHSSLIH